MKESLQAVGYLVLTVEDEMGQLVFLLMLNEETAIPQQYS